MLIPRPSPFPAFWPPLLSPQLTCADALTSKCCIYTPGMTTFAEGSWPPRARLFTDRNQTSHNYTNASIHFSTGTPLYLFAHKHTLSSELVTPSPPPRGSTKLTADRKIPFDLFDAFSWTDTPASHVPAPLPSLGPRCSPGERPTP